MKHGWFYLIGFLLLMGFDSIGAISFKYAGMHALPVEANIEWLLRLFAKPWVYGAVVGYIGAFFTWMTLLKHAPIGPAFAASHLEVVSVMLLSVWLFDEHLTAGRGRDPCRHRLSGASRKPRARAGTCRSLSTG